MKIYTNTGDDGTTGLFGGARVKKASLRVEAYGTVDELNATIGIARATTLDPFSEGVLAQVQVDLFTLGAELACVPGKEEKLGMTLIDADDAARGVPAPGAHRLSARRARCARHGRCARTARCRHLSEPTQRSALHSRTSRQCERRRF